jgi:hypothetical protein
MSLLTSDIELQGQQLKSGCSRSNSLDDLFKDWIVADCFDSVDSEGHSSLSDDDFDFFGQDSKESEKNQTVGAQDVSMADLNSARKAEQAWQAIRSFSDDNPASLQSADQNCISSSQLDGAQSTFSLTPRIGGLIKRDSPSSSSHQIPNSSLPSPSSHLLGCNGFQTLTIRDKLRTPSPSAKSRLKKFLRSRSPPTMSSESQCRSMSSKQKLDHLGSYSSGHFNISGNLQHTSSRPLSVHDTPNNSYEATLLPPEKRCIQPPNTPVASPIFDRRPGSQSSLNSSHLRGYPPHPSTQTVNLNMMLTPPATGSMDHVGWPLEDTVSVANGSSNLPKSCNSWNTDSGVGAQETHKVRPQSSPSQMDPMGLGINLSHGNADNINAVNPAMLTSSSQQITSVKAGTINGSHSTQDLIGLNGVSCIGQAVDLSPMNNFSASALSQPLLYSPAHLATQMASPSRRSLPGYFTPFPSHEVRNISDPPCPPAGFPHSSPLPSKTVGSPRSSHRRSKSTSHHRRKSSSSSSTSPQHASISFVNFTPNDSRKILTGVAPSGSSKTKARREKEAAEKRRKIGEFAMNAVLQAGGDPRALQVDGFNELVEGSI